MVQTLSERKGRGVHGSREEAPLSWYAVQVKAREEEKTRDRLEQRDYTVYLPMTWADKRQRKDGKEKIPLFTGYLFCRMAEGFDEFRPVSNTPGVMRIVRLSAEKHAGNVVLMPTPLEDEDIAALKRMEVEQGIIDTRHDYQEGDEVRITSGPFAGYEAIIYGTARQRVEALLEFMGHRQRLRLSRGQIEPVN